ncbi:MAG TPA: c-type cytochrome [Vineibacter sp.]|nr:c-type cytochrome [Vineibacter sp.]
MRRRSVWKRNLLVLAAVAIPLTVVAGVLFWWKFLKSEAQVFARDDATQRFKYGSLDAELLAGIPYQIFMVLPRVFPDLVEKYATAGYGPAKPGHGGYGAFGLAWEEGQRLPVGLSVRRLGFERVTANCALCHTTSYRFAPDDLPRFAVGGPGHTVNVQGLLRFLFAAANDRRFSATRLLPEMALQFDFDLLDKAIFALVIIPKTKLALQLGERELGWIDSKPAWGPGRDDAFNLPKYILSRSPWDDTVGNTDFPALWRMGDRGGHLLHWGGEAKSVYGVIATSALGAGSLPTSGFVERNRWIEAFMDALAPPAFPAEHLDSRLIARGEALFVAQCAACHAKGGARVGTAIPLAEIGTDPEHVRTWSQADAERFNRLLATLGVDQAAMQGAQGYVARPLPGVWLLAPYLHNGSVPTLRDLLSPPAQRPAVFYRGYDVIDPVNVGFVATGGAAEARGFRFDTQLKGNGNGGHLYGTDLPAEDRDALIEYLKTL